MLLELLCFEIGVNESLLMEFSHACVRCHWPNRFLGIIGNDPGWYCSVFTKQEAVAILLSSYESAFGGLLLKVFFGVIITNSWFSNYSTPCLV